MTTSNSRRNFLRNMFKISIVAGSGGLLWSQTAQKVQSSPLTLRPPGALEKEKFQKACIRCGQCVTACPYDTLKLATPNENTAPGTPFFNPREIPCYMCTNYPCTQACPSGALDIKELVKDAEGSPSINNAKMGIAVVHKESCVAFWGIQCEVCYRACPLMGKAISMEYEKNPQTQKHANRKPVIHSDFCTGCGLCEKSCITEKAAIFVLPKDRATGKVGNHYIKSWDEADESRIDTEKKETLSNDVKSALDYLNDSEDLFD